MSTFLVASRGVGFMIATQVIIGVGQFVYSAVTARAFTPTEFGSFAAALSLQGLLILLTTTGLPSIVLREASLTRTDVVWIRLYALIGGSIAGLIFLVLSPYWILLLGAPGGSQFLPLLAAALVIGPLAGVESSLLRREGRPTADMTTFLLAFVVPAGVAVAVVLTVREAWAMSLVTLLYPVVLGGSSAALRRMRYMEPGSRRHGILLGFAWKVSAQNVGFLLISQASGWVLSATLGASALGAYSRAGTLAGVPGTAISTALNRAVQPHWRKLSEPESTARAIRDATLFTSNLAFPMFAILAVVGPDLAAIWLGPGWGEVGILLPWLAVAFGVQVPFGVLASSLEMRGHFSVVRLGQVGLVAGLAVGIGVFLATKDPRMAAVAAALSQVVGLLALLGAMTKTSHTKFRSLLWAVGLPAIWACGVGLFALAGIELSHDLSWRLFGNMELAATTVGVAISLAVWIGSFRWQPASQALAERGVPLPRFMKKSQIKGPASPYETEPSTTIE
jgi:lipopolysaccharide exporter